MVNIGTGAGANVSQPVDKSANDDIIDVRGNPNHDGKGRFTFGKVKMSKKEYNRISSAICTDHPDLKDDKKNYDYFYDNYYYVFNVVEPGTYNFIFKVKLGKNNKKKIDFIRENLINGKK